MDQLLDDSVYSIAISPGSAGWYFIDSRSRQNGTSGTYQHRLNPGSYTVLVTTSGAKSIDLTFFEGIAGRANRRISLVASGANGVSRSGATTISVTNENAYISFQPAVNFTQAEIDAGVSSTVQVFKTPSYKPTA
ncbi:hypothetical protein [Corynebacterium glutamicum]|uniref:hypothetical protein n=1 Tax=Corynebacterium glutamicum TaxID=1718 RepID=UPI0014673507|nr:hypothetical protein [Corynebacterium glutamicum]GFK19189.1 hypothetical protein KbCgl_17610 [Corynebacterium glutamicum]